MLEAVEHPESVVMEKIPTVQFKRQILTALLWTLVMNLAIVILAVLKWEIAVQILSSFVEVGQKKLLFNLNIGQVESL